MPPGCLTLPPDEPPGEVLLRFGCNQVKASLTDSGQTGRALLAADLWKRLKIPFSGLRVELRRTESGEIELGPTIAVLYPGDDGISRREAEERVRLYYGHLRGAPGLLTLGFDEEIDWKRGEMKGFVLDNRAGREGEVVCASFPIPAVVRLTWSIRRSVIEQLRSLTGNRTFNWVRSIGKWQFHSLLSADPVLQNHLPETRVMRGITDLAAMLVRHPVLFVKHAHGIKGLRSVRIRRSEAGFELSHMSGDGPVERSFGSLGELKPYLGQVIGPGLRVVQQGIGITGLEGRALDFRVVTVRQPEGGWRVVAATANVAPDERVAFTNLANGATDEEMTESLLRHHGMNQAEAEECARRMAELAVVASATLEQSFSPLGILGFDVAVESESHRLWLFEANAVPGWGYPPEIELELARSQIDFGLSLTGFSDGQEAP